MINYIYTRDFSGGDLNVQMLAWLADKYDIPGMMELLLLRMKKDQVADPGKVADMLITAERHNSDVLKKIALDKLRKNKEMLRNPAFLGKLSQNIMTDLFMEFIP